MFKKSIMALAIAAVVTASMGGAASAKGWKGGHHWGGHYKGHRYVKIYTPRHYTPSCRYYKKKWKWTGYKYWKKKYKACLILKNY